MKITNDVLNILYKNSDFVSGQNIADELQVSRTAIWKAINELKALNYEIESYHNGYKLTYDIVHKDTLKDLLPNDIKLELLDTVDSTNTYLRENYSANNFCNKLVISRTQTKGRGRYNKTFFSPPDTGIYMSLIIKPNLAFNLATRITAITSISIVNAIEKLTNIPVNIKWVNDIYVNDKKICGILTESAMSMENAMLDYIIIGIGINIDNANNFNEELKDIASSLFDFKAPKFFKNLFISEIINNILTNINDIKNPIFVKKYNENLYKKNEHINFKLNSDNTVYNGKILGVDNNFNLIIKTTINTFKLGYGEFIIL